MPDDGNEIGASGRVESSGLIGAAPSLGNVNVAIGRGSSGLSGSGFTTLPLAEA